MSSSRDSSLLCELATSSRHRPALKSCEVGSKGGSREQAAEGPPFARVESPEREYFQVPGRTWRARQHRNMGHCGTSATPRTDGLALPRPAPAQRVPAALRSVCPVRPAGCGRRCEVMVQSLRSCSTSSAYMTRHNSIHSHHRACLFLLFFFCLVRISSSSANSSAKQVSERVVVL